MSYIANINKKEFQVKNELEHWSIDDQEYKLKISDKSKNIITLTNKTGEVVEAVIQRIDTDKKKVVLLIQQKELTIDILEPIDQKMLSLGIDTKKLSKAKNIKAPMPGLIIKTLVEEEDNVKEGEPLFVLEAMKMENVFKAPADVKIKKILIKEGETVDKNQELITFA